MRKRITSKYKLVQCPLRAKTNATCQQCPLNIKNTLLVKKLSFVIEIRKFFLWCQLLKMMFLFLTNSYSTSPFSVKKALCLQYLEHLRGSWFRTFFTQILIFRRETMRSFNIPFWSKASFLVTVGPNAAIESSIHAKLPPNCWNVSFEYFAALTS